MTERWTDVRGHPGYEVSNIGRVRNKKNEGVLATHLNRKGGYLRVTLDGKHHYVHRLVADSFYDGDHSGREVNHINGDKTDNTLSNLEWIPHRENSNHAFIHGLEYPSTLKVVCCKFCKHRNEYRFCEGRPDEFYCADGERDE